MRATNLAKRERFARQVIDLDERWQIRRADKLNWELRFKGKRQGFYGTLLGAFQALPAKMLQEEASGTLVEVTRTLRGIVEKVESAFTPSLIEATKFERPKNGNEEKRTQKI